MAFPAAIIGGSLIAGGVSLYGARKSAKAQQQAAQTAADTSLQVYQQQREDFLPFYEYGKEAIPGLRGYEQQYPRPSWEETVYNPMEAWKYEQSPAYQAKYSLGQEELNKQLQARGLASSGIGANRAADLARRLTAEDYAKERDYRLGQYTDLYKGRMAENTDRYNRLLDAVKVGQGAAGSLGTAGNQYAEQVGRSSYLSGAAEGAYYAGMPNALLTGIGTGLRTYDYGKNAGWWNSGGNQAQTNTSNSNIGYENWTPDMWGA